PRHGHGRHQRPRYQSRLPRLGACACRAPRLAAADLRRALALWEKAKAGDVEDHFERGRALALLAGLAADGRSGVTSAEAAAFADQAVAALRAALQAGWGQYDELKEPDFDPLRKREDFQKLVKEQEAKAAATDRPSDNPQPGPGKE